MVREKTKQEIRNSKKKKKKTRTDNGCLVAWLLLESDGNAEAGAISTFLKGLSSMNILTEEEGNFVFFFALYFCFPLFFSIFSLLPHFFCSNFVSLFVFSFFLVSFLVSFRFFSYFSILDFIWNFINSIWRNIVHVQPPPTIHLPVPSKTHLQLKNERRILSVHDVLELNSLSSEIDTSRMRR